MVEMLSDDIMNSIKVPTLSVNREFPVRVEWCLSVRRKLISRLN